VTRFRCFVAAAIATVACAVQGAGAADPVAGERAQALERRYDRVQDFSADFIQTYRGGVLKKTIAERGRLLIKKPGKMRWEYTAPEQKLFVSDGVKLYSYLPADKQVIVSTVPRDDRATTPTLFLAGKGSLTRDFDATLVDPPAGFSPPVEGLKLVPKVRQPDYESLVLAVDPGRLEIRGLVTVDAQGGTSTLAFDNLKENVGIADKEFTFKIPRGVDVVTDSSR
jgi:outer membrane lipoprotein carrier protein